jgi:hypothetical protein
MLNVISANHSSGFSAKKGGMLLIMIGVMILSIACYRAVGQYKFLQKASLTQGEVVGSQLGSATKNQQVKMPVIKYLDANGIIHYLLAKDTIFPDHPFKMHQQLPVAYDSHHVERAQLYMTFSPSYLNAIVFCMIALGLIGIGMLFIFDPERQN